MAYARYGSDSDVYVYLSADYLLCMQCNVEGLEFNSQGAIAYTTADMLKHLEQHRAVGDKVPDECVECLKQDAEENDAWIAQYRAEEAEEEAPEGSEA